MTESIVQCQPRPRQRVFIKLSGGRFFTIPASQAGALEVGTVLSEAEVEKLSRLDQYDRGKRKALRLLSIRSRTRREIGTAIDRLGLEASIRDGILHELEETGLVDDRRFAREYVRSGIDSKQLGPHRLKFALGKLGVSASIIDATVEEAFSSGTQEILARALVRKRLGSRVPDEKTVRRLSETLKRKGFDFEVVNQVIYELLKRCGGEAGNESAGD